MNDNGGQTGKQIIGRVKEDRIRDRREDMLRTRKTVRKTEWRTNKDRQGRQIIGQTRKTKKKENRMDGRQHER